MTAHAVPHGVGPALHPADFLQRHTQLSQQLDLEQDADLGLAIVPIAVFAVSPGGQKALGLIKANVLPGDAHQGLHLVDFQAAHLAFRYDHTPSRRGKVKEFLKKS